MKKNMFLAVLLVVMLFLLNVAGSYASPATVGETEPADSFIVDDIRYHVLSLDERTVEVTSKEGGYAGDIAVPASVDHGGTTFDVVQIGNRAFEDCKEVTSVSLPSSVKCIELYAFFGCEGLTSFTVPEGVETIEDSAFDGCENMESISLPQSLKSIGNWTFNYCRKLKSLTIPKGVTSIGYALGGWYYEMETMRVQEGNAVYDSRDNCNAIIETATNTLIAGCTATVIPSSVTAIGPWAFNACLMFELPIPESVTTIDDRAFFGNGFQGLVIPSLVSNLTQAFYECIFLTDIVSYIQTPSPLDALTFSFDSFKVLPTLYVPAGRKQVYEQTEGWKKFEHIIELGDDDLAFEPYFWVDGIRYHVTSLADRTVEVASRRTYNRPNNDERYFYTDETISIPATVENGKYVYRVTGIGERAFQESRTSTFVLPDGIERLTALSFYFCKNISHINIPLSVKEIEPRAFDIRGSGAAFWIENPTPLVIDDMAFSSLVSGDTLYVPRGSKVLYEAAEGWKKFGTIKEYPELPEEAEAELARVEYFFDSDPGFGLGRPLGTPVVGGNTFVLDLSGVDAGAHILYIRAADSFGRWSPTMARPLYVVNPKAHSLTAVEYFFDDDDPGEGRAMSVALDPSSDGTVVLAIDIEQLSIGSHQLKVRACDDKGQWSLVECQSFVITQGDGVHSIGQEHSSKVKSAAYNVAGQPVILPRRGVNIIDGKKVVIK